VTIRKADLRAGKVKGTTGLAPGSGMDDDTEDILFSIANPAGALNPDGTIIPTTDHAEDKPADQ